MGIPKSLSTQQAGSLPWTFTGGDHYTQPVFKKGIPVDSAEDNEAHEIGKYERNELTRLIITDGVFLGDVWNDGSQKDSFKVTYGGGVLTVKSGRAVVGKRRIDLGAGAGANQDITNSTIGAYINGYVLPAVGHEHVFYAQIYERAVPGPIYFPPAGTSANRSKYFDMLQDVRYYDSASPGSAFAPPNTPDTNSQAFIEIGRIDDAGVVTDTRVLSHVKAPSTGLAGLVVKKNGIVGQDCTHTSLYQAIQDSASTWGSENDSGHKVIWIKKGLYDLVAEGATLPLALPFNVVLFGCVQERQISSIATLGNYPSTPPSIPTISGSAAGFAFTGFPIAFWNLIFNITPAGPTGGGILQNPQCAFVRCIFQNAIDTGQTTNCAAYFFECNVINYNVNQTSSTFKFERCRISLNGTASNQRWLIASGTAAVPNVFKDCYIEIEGGAVASPYTSACYFQSAGYSYFEGCQILFKSSLTLTGLSAIGGESFFKYCSFFGQDSAVSVNTIAIYIGNVSAFHECSAKFDFAGLFIFAVISDGGTCNFHGGSYTNVHSGASTVIMFQVQTSSGSGTVFARFQNVNIETSSGKCVWCNSSGTANISLEMKGCSVTSRGANASYVVQATIGSTSTMNFFLSNTTLRHTDTTVALYLQSGGGGPTFNSYIMNCVIFTGGTTSIQKDFAITMTNTTYIGDITGGNLAINTQNTGEGQNCNNVKIGGTASPSGTALTGEMKMYGGVAAPVGWLMCDGSAISRATYSNLFAVVGTAFGVGNGTTTFNIPDLRGRVPVGAGTGAGLTNRVLGSKFGEENHLLILSEAPSHAHTVGLYAQSINLDAAGLVPADSSHPAFVGTDSQGGDQPHNNMQPSQAVNYIIKT